MTPAAHSPRSAEPPATTSAADAAQAPRHGWLIAIALYVLSTMTLGFPALTGKLLLNPRSDQYIAGYSFRDFAARHFREFGEIPQWNPYLFGGMPFVDAMHGDTFYPTALLRLLIGTGPGMTWGLIIHVFLAGVFAFLFLRTMRLSFVASLVGGLAYQIGGNVAGLVSPGHDGKLFLCALLPLALYLVARGIRDGKRWAFGPLAIVIGLGVLSPHPQLLQYMLLLTGAFALFMAWDTSRLPDAPSGRDRAMRLAAALVSVIVGMAMGAIQFWSVRGYTAFSPRSGGLSREAAVSYSMPIEEIFNFAIPQFTGMLDRYWGSNGIHFHSEYIGITTLVLVGLAFGAWKSRTETRTMRFFVAALVISLLWALGGNTPFYNLPYALVPGTKFFRAPSTMLFIVSFCFAVLAAFGAERIMRGADGRKSIIVLAAVVATIGILGILGGLTSAGSAIAGPERVARVLANDPDLRAGSLRAMAFGLLLCGTAWMTMTRRLSRDLASALLVAIVLVDIWSVVRHYWIFSPSADVLFASDDTLDYLKAQPAPVRAYTDILGQPQNFRDPNLTGDGLMAHALPVVWGYHGNHIQRYERLLGEGNSQLGNPNAWKLLNMKYILTNVPDLGIGATVVAGPDTNAAGNTVYLHELPVQTSYAWVASAIVKAEEDAVAATVLDPRFDMRTVALFDTSVAVEGQTLTTLPAPSNIQVSVTNYRAGAATLALSAPAPVGAALVVSENYYPGWVATVDGKPATVGTADVSLIGVVLPEGARTVELRFENRPYEVGKRITLIALGIALVMWALGLFAGRRRTVAVA